MTPLDAAKALMEVGEPEGCTYSVHHEPGCPMLALPQIVAALEVAERLMIKTREPIEESAERDGNRWYAFCGSHPDDGHRPRCPWEALVAALKREVVPRTEVLTGTT